MESNGQAASGPAKGIPTIVTMQSVRSEIVAREAAITPKEQAERKRQEQERQRSREQELRYKEAQERECFVKQFGRRYVDCTLDNFVLSVPKMGEVVTALRGYVNDFPDHFKRGEGVILFGPPGSGKDHLAVAACIAIYDNWPKWSGRRYIKFCSGLELYQDIRDGMKKDRSEYETMAPLIDATLLVLSDPLPPRGPLTDWQASVLLQVIDSRYRGCRPTIVTLNIASGAEGDERMGPQTLDRLKDGSLSFYCDWPSHRKTAT